METTRRSRRDSHQEISRRPRRSHHESIRTPWAQFWSTATVLPPPVLAAFGSSVEILPRSKALMLSRAKDIPEFTTKLLSGDCLQRTLCESFDVGANYAPCHSEPRPGATQTILFYTERFNPIACAAQLGKWLLKACTKKTGFRGHPVDVSMSPSHWKPCFMGLVYRMHGITPKSFRMSFFMIPNPTTRKEFLA